MINNKLRIGRGTSSQAYRLMKNARNNKDAGASFFTYADEIVAERKLGRSIDTGAYSQPMAWGKFMEIVVFESLDVRYEMSTQTTKEHPTMGHIWSGSCDLEVAKVKIGELKAYQPKKFSQYADCLLKQDVTLLKNEFEEEYWQIVSNSIIHSVPKGEALLFMPKAKDMPAIREMVENYEGSDKWQYRFITEKPDYELPVLPDNSIYESLIQFEFAIPVIDKLALTKRFKQLDVYVNHALKK